MNDNLGFADDYKGFKIAYIDENKKLGEVNWEPCC